MVEGLVLTPILGISQLSDPDFQKKSNYIGRMMGDFILNEAGLFVKQKLQPSRIYIDF